MLLYNLLKDIEARTPTVTVEVRKIRGFFRFEILQPAVSLGSPKPKDHVLYTVIESIQSSFRAIEGAGYTVDINTHITAPGFYKVTISLQIPQNHWIYKLFAGAEADDVIDSWYVLRWYELYKGTGKIPDWRATDKEALWAQVLWVKV